MMPKLRFDPVTYQFYYRCPPGRQRAGESGWVRLGSAAASVLDLGPQGGGRIGELRRQLRQTSVVGRPRSRTSVRVSEWR